MDYHYVVYAFVPMAEIFRSGNSKIERNAKMKRGYRIWSTDEQIISAMMESLMLYGKISRDYVCAKCHCGSKRINEIAESVGVELPNRSSQRERKTGRGNELQRGDNTFVHTCKEAIKNEGLDTPLGQLLSIITRTPLQTLKKMASGQVVNVEHRPITGIVQRSYATSLRSSTSSF